MGSAARLLIDWDVPRTVLCDSGLVPLGIVMSQASNGSVLSPPIKRHKHGKLKVNPPNDNYRTVHLAYMCDTDLNT